MAGQMIVADQVGFRYPDKKAEGFALEAITFQIPKGERVALLGPNGSGKSTLFRILSTLVLPQSGRLEIDGISVKAPTLASVRKSLATVFQNPALDPNLTVIENLQCQAVLFGLTVQQTRERLERSIAQLGLAPFCSHRVSNLSGGWKRRTDLARALLSRGKLLLLDEPTSGLDVEAREKLWAVLQKMQQQEQLTLVFTTHLLEEAEGCNRWLFLKNGKLAAQGRPEDLMGSLPPWLVTIDTEKPVELGAALENLYGVHLWRRPGKLQFSPPQHFETQPLQDQFGKWIRNLSLSRPSLEDFYWNLEPQAGSLPQEFKT